MVAYVGVIELMSDNPYTARNSMAVIIDLNKRAIKNKRDYISELTKQINEMNISERGKVSLTIEGYSLEAGIYLYSLIADGQVIDTKRMILTK